MNTVGDHVVSQWFKIDAHTKGISGMFITVSVYIGDRVVYSHSLCESGSGKRIIAESYS